MSLPMDSLILIFINNPTEKRASIFPLSYKENEIPTVPKWWLAFTPRCLCLQHLRSQPQESRGISEQGTKRNFPGPQPPVLRCRGTANSSSTASLWLLSLSTENTQWWGLPAELITQKASKSCQRTALQPVSFPSMTNENSLHPCFTSVSPQI